MEFNRAVRTAYTQVKCDTARYWVCVWRQCNFAIKVSGGVSGSSVHFHKMFGVFTQIKKICSDRKFCLRVVQHLNIKILSIFTPQKSDDADLQRKNVQRYHHLFSQLR